MYIKTKKKNENNLKEILLKNNINKIFLLNQYLFNL